MNRHAAVMRHAEAGRLEPVRLFLRYRDSDTPPRGDAPEPRLAEGWLRPGTQEVGPFRVRLACDIEGECATYELSLRNGAERPLRLEALGLGFRWRPPRLAAPRFLRQGWQSWSFAGGWPLDEVGEPPFPSGPWLRGFHRGLARVPSDRSGWHEADLVTAVAAAPGGPAVCAGVLESGRALGVVFLRREDASVRLELEQWWERPLEPGATLEGEAVRVALGAEAERLLEAHAADHGRRAGARNGAPFRPGWCSWYQFFHEVDEASLLRNLEALAAARETIPVEVVQLDDGYQRAVGDWLETNARFPRGLAPLAAEIRDAGFVPGIWVAPFCVVPESQLFASHPDWLLRAEDGLLRGLYHGQWSREGWVHVLDPSHDPARDHLLRTAAALVALGFQYLKLDFLYTAALTARAHDPTLSRVARLRRGLDAIRAGAGEDAFLLGCGCPLGAAVGVVDGMRIGPDTAPAWDTVEALRIPGLEPTLPAARNALRNTLARAWMHRRLWQNDPDCLMTRGSDTELSAAEVRTLAVAAAATGGMLVLSDDLPALAPERRALAAGTIELARRLDRAGGGRPLALLEDDVAAGAVARGTRDGWLALFNGGEERVRRDVDVRALGLQPADAAPEPLLDSPPPGEWKEGRLAVELDAHEAVLYRLRMLPPLAVFCDFDGTFAVQDVGSTLARRYAGARRAALWDRLTRGELTAWEYNLELLDGLPLPEVELEAFLQTVQLDPGARELVAWCEHEGVPFRVLSDGFDRNLDRLQELHRIRFDYDANRLRYEAEAWRIEAAHPNPACDCGTGTCKRGRIEAFRREYPDVVIVHIGNGRVSDLCGALAADVVFAKDSLAEALAERAMRFEHFETLYDVRAALERLLAHLSGS